LPFVLTLKESVLIETILYNPFEILPKIENFSGLLKFDFSRFLHNYKMCVLGHNKR